MNPLIPFYVTLQTFVQDRVERIKDRDRGASALEYGALIAVAAVVIGFLYTALNGADIVGKVTGAITKMFSNSGGSSG